MKRRSAIKTALAGLLGAMWPWRQKTAPSIRDRLTDTNTPVIFCNWPGNVVFGRNTTGKTISVGKAVYSANDKICRVLYHRPRSLFDQQEKSRD